MCVKNLWQLDESMEQRRAKEKCDGMRILWYNGDMTGKIAKLSSDIKKRTAKTLAAVCAAVALGISLLPVMARTEPVSVQPEQPAAIVQVLETPEEADLLEPAEAAESRRRRGARQCVLSAIRSACGVLGSFLVTAAVRIGGFLLTSLCGRLFGAPIATLMAFLGEVLVLFLIMFLLFSWLFKRLFPHRKLRELWTGRNLLLLLAGSVLLAALRLFLQRLDGEGRVLFAIAEAVLTVLTFAAIWLCLLSRCTARGGRIGRMTRRALCSRPVVLAFLLVTAVAAGTAYVRIRFPVISMGKALLSFIMLFLLCTAACAAIAALYVPVRSLPEPGPSVTTQ